MKPTRDPWYLAWIRTLPCLVCGSTKGIEASHTCPRGLGQKSSDTSTIPLCYQHHGTGTDSYHKLGARRFALVHNLDVPVIVRRLNLKPVIRIESDTLSATWKIDSTSSEEHMRELGPQSARW
jgi:hypothetical protein